MKRESGRGPIPGLNCANMASQFTTQNMFALVIFIIWDFVSTTDLELWQNTYTQTQTRFYIRYA